MPFATIISGILLVVIGVAGYVYGLSTEHASPTALIPAAFGLLLVILGGMCAAAAEGTQKHLVHAAMTVALIGFVLIAGRLIIKIADITWSAAVLSLFVMSVICLVLV